MSRYGCKETRVLVVSDDDSVLRSMTSFHGIKIVAHGPSLETVLPVLKEMEPDVLIIDPKKAKGVDVEGLSTILRSFLPNLRVMTVGEAGVSIMSGDVCGTNGLEEGGQEIGEAVFRSGPDHGALRQGLRRESQTQVGHGDWREEFRLRISQVSDSIPGGSSPPNGLAFPNSIKSTPVQVGCRVATVFSPKGGVGKTFIAANLAAILATRTPLKVAIMDLDLCSADVAVHLDLMHGPTITDMIPFFDELTAESLRKFLVRHRPTGLDVVLGPRRPELAELVKAEGIQKLVEVMAREYNVIVIDTAPDPGDDVACDCLENSHVIMLVTSTDAASLRQTKTTLEVLKKLNSSIPNRCHLVVNRWPSPTSLSIQQLESFFGQKICAVIQDDRRAVESSIMNGKPFVIQNKSHPITSSIVSLAGLFYPMVENEGSHFNGRSRSWFFRIGRGIPK